MHDGSPATSVSFGVEWLRKHIDPYYQWAKAHNSLLIVTFDEDARSSLIYGAEVESANSTRKAGPLVMRLS